MPKIYTEESFREYAKMKQKCKPGIMTSRIRTSLMICTKEQVKEITNHDFLIASRVTGERYVSASIATSNEVSSFSLQVCFPILVVSSVKCLEE